MFLLEMRLAWRSGPCIRKLLLCTSHLGAAGLQTTHTCDSVIRVGFSRQHTVQEAPALGGWGLPGPAPMGSPAGPQQGPCGSKPPTFLTLQGPFLWVWWLRVGCLAAGAAASWGQPQSPPCELQADFPRWFVGGLSTLVVVDQDSGGPWPRGTLLLWPDHSS